MNEIPPWPLAVVWSSCILKRDEVLRIKGEDSLSVETTPFLVLKVPWALIRVELITRRFPLVFQWQLNAEIYQLIMIFIFYVLKHCMISSATLIWRVMISYLYFEAWPVLSLPVFSHWFFPPAFSPDLFFPGLFSPSSFPTRSFESRFFLHWSFPP